MVLEFLIENLAIMDFPDEGFSRNQVIYDLWGTRTYRLFWGGGSSIPSRMPYPSSYRRAYLG
jgi:hypothetical protein